MSACLYTISPNCFLFVERLLYSSIKGGYSLLPLWLLTVRLWTEQRDASKEVENKAAIAIVLAELYANCGISLHTGRCTSNKRPLPMYRRRHIFGLH